METVRNAPHSRVLSIAAGVCPGMAPADFVSAVAEAGWMACGIWFDSDTWSAEVSREVRQRLDDTGLLALDMEPIFVLPDAHGGTTDHGERVIEAAAQVGARNVLTVGRGVEPDRFTERFGELCDLAAGADVTCVVEFMGFMSIHTLADALTVVETVDRPNAGILVDNLHLARTGGTPDDLSRVDPALLPYAQLCDALAQSPDELIVEALDGRFAPGTGDLPVEEFVAALPDQLPMSMEVRSAALRGGFPDPVDRARHLRQLTEHFFERISR